MTDSTSAHHSANELVKTDHEQAHNRDEHADGEHSQQQQHRQRKNHEVPDAQECLAAIARVAQLAALGLLTPAKANAIRGSYQTILQHHQKKTQESSQGLSDESVLAILERDPQLLSLFEPSLSQAQVDMVLQSGQGSNT